MGEITQIETREMLIILMKFNGFKTLPGLELLQFMRLTCMKHEHFDQCFVTYAFVFDHVA